jgi:hypothetical protein
MGNPFKVHNPEQPLIEEMLFAARMKRGVPPSEVWRNGFDEACEPFLLTAKSLNQLLIALALGYWYGEKKAAAALKQQFFADSRSTWMGTEFLSTIYGVWGHLMPVALILRKAQESGDDTLTAAALGWGRQWYGINRKCRTTDGAVLTVGARSGGHWQVDESLPISDAVWPCWLLAETGEEKARWEAAARRLNVGFRQHSNFLLADALEPEMAMMREPGADEWYGLVTPLHVLRGADGGALAVWIEQSPNPNTPSLMAASINDGLISYLPIRGGSHVRKDSDQATCERQGSLLVYTSVIGGQDLQTMGIASGVEEVYGAISGPISPVQPPGPTGEDIPALPVPAQPDKPKRENHWTGWL